MLAGEDTNALSYTLGTVTGMTSPRPTLLPLQDDPTGRTLGLDLPPGRLLDTTFEGTWPEPLVWRSDTLAQPGDWARLHEATRQSGL